MANEQIMENIIDELKYNNYGTNIQQGRFI